MAANTKWPMRSFWVTEVYSDQVLKTSEPWTTQMSLLLNIVTPTKAHEYAASLGLIHNMCVCSSCGNTMYLGHRVYHKFGTSWICKTSGCGKVTNVREHSFLDSSLGMFNFPNFTFL